MGNPISKKAGVVRFTAGLLVGIMVLCLAGCGEVSATKQNRLDTEAATETLLQNQPTPTDIEYSLERFNLTKRAYWVNGLFEKANAVPCPVERPIGYIVCLLEGVGPVFQSTVDGKVSSLNSYLSADSDWYECGGSSYHNDWLADVDGSYGTNVDGVFWFTVDGHYMEWPGKYIYSDVPFNFDAPVLEIKTSE